MAPIDPVQLLKALAPLLSTNGGINGIEKAPQFASLMKKFSKKLVSRCVYCNVLKATAPEILARFLEEGGWNTINMWLNDAKENSNQYFLLELLELCKVLPMTLDRLKENNTPKVVKALTKYENGEIKSLSNELVTCWMTIIKGDNVVEIIKKKRKLSKENEKEPKEPKKDVKVKEPSTKDKKDVKKSTKEQSVVQKVDKKTVKETLPQVPEKNIKENLKTNIKDVPKRPEKIRGNKRTSSERDFSKTDMYEDVKIKMDPEPVLKKPKTDRPKTVKSYQAKFRATGLEEEIPLPKKNTKKNLTVDKNAAVALAKSAVVKRFNSTSNERITEKRIKPESLLAVNENANSNGGIKLIPAKPRPAHILHESASFMDALVATPAVAPKRKKKAANKPPAPPSPTLKPPKLQFYKDTLEMNSEESENKDSSKESENGEKDSPSSPTKDELGDSSEKSDCTAEQPGTPTNDDAATAEDSISKRMEEESKEIAKEEEEEKIKDPNKLVSILAHGKRRHRRKTVRWVEDEDLKQIFYFELDETERVNVLRTRPFGDLKSIEAKREREAFEAAKRHAGDKMEEAIPWWIVPILIDIPPPLAIPGCYSQEKEIQHLRQQSILQEIYFTREMVPDSPQEPDVELTSPHEPKIIPLDEENVVGSILDYSAQENPKPKTSLPEVLSSLIKIPSSRPQTQQSILGQLPVEPNVTQHQPSAASPTSPYDPGEPVGPALLGVPPPGVQPIFNHQPQMLEPENLPMPNSWGPMEGNMMPPDPYYQGYMNQPMMMDGMPSIPPGGGNDGMRMRMSMPMMGRDMFRPNMVRGGPYPMNRPGGPRHNRRTVPCRHFVAGSCRFGAACSFLHPGINGPPL